MDDLSISEIVRGVVDESYKNERVQLLQLLANKVGESTEHMTPDESKSVFTIAVAKLDTKTDPTLISLFLSLLTNATISDENVKSFLAFLAASEKFQNIFHEALNTFLDHNPQIEQDEAEDAWENMASVMCNLAQVEEGRTMLLRQSKEYMIRLISQVRSKNVVRRRGAVGSIRSCLFDQDIHWWMIVDAKVVDTIALPLVVAVPFTEMEKVGMNPLWWLLASDPERLPEPDLEIMRMLLECIVLLCQRRGLREELRKRKVYNVVKNLDTKCEDERVSELIYEIVNLLMGDEDPSNPMETYTAPALKG
eukprot:gene20656-23462_t